jgi:hypothetical protein
MSHALQGQLRNRPPTVAGIRAMRKVLAQALLLPGAVVGVLASQAEAGFHHRPVNTYPCMIVTPSPSVYGPGFAIAPCPPNIPPGRGGFFGHHGWGYRYGANGYGGSGACGTCGNGVASADEASTAVPATSDRITNEKVISDQPAGDPEPAPPQDKEARAPGRVHFRLTGMRQDGSAEFKKGLTAFRAKTFSEALGSFESAIAIEPDNALYHYYQAMTLFNLNGPEAGQESLSRAVALEQEQPITDWGKRLEREQGRARAWVEKARRDAGITK